MMVPVARHSAIDRLISSDAPVAIGVSGGKDSQAAALASFAHLDACGHVGPRILIHSDLGSVEWNDSLPTCERLAAHLGCDLVVVRRKAGDMMQRWRARWHSSVQRYEDLSTVTLVPCWSTPDMRFCTSELKTHIIMAELKRRFGRCEIVNVTGIRRQESRNRARMPVADVDKSGRIWSWRPIIDLTEADVFTMIESSGLMPHEAYRQFGMSRVSCRFCIMSNLGDLVAASAQEESHSIFREMVRLEIDSSFAFQEARWLGDIAPQILTAEERAGLAIAKHRASLRKEIEGQITKPMLYVKGWPTRMLTDDEATTLASVRSRVSELYGFASGCLTADAIHARYAELIGIRERRAA